MFLSHKKSIKHRKKNKSIPFWSGWKDEKPSIAERTEMLKKCGKKCFLRRPKGYPICRRKTCKISQKGVMSAYIRSREMHNKFIEQKAIGKMTRKTRKHFERL